MTAVLGAQARSMTAMRAASIPVSFQVSIMIASGGQIGNVVIGAAAGCVPSRAVR